MASKKPERMAAPQSPARHGATKPQRMEAPQTATKYPARFAQHATAHAAKRIPAPQSPPRQ